jgi:hypothetical protein
MKPDTLSDTIPDTLNEAVGVLTRREIEARILKPLIDAFAARFGRDETLELLREVVKDAAREGGLRMRAQAGGEDLVSFAAQWEPWFRGGALEIEELERTPETWAFNVTRCRYAELYKELGLETLGGLLSCNRDAALVEGFSDSIAFERTQTIMEGAACCDFRYRRKPAGTTEGS